MSAYRLKMFSAVIGAASVVLMSAVALFHSNHPDSDEADWHDVNSQVEMWLETQEAAAAEKIETSPEKQVSVAIDVNRASAEELDALPGIGPAKASAIVAYREENGPFQQLEDLMNVKGIGPSTFERIRGQLSIAAP